MLAAAAAPARPAGTGPAAAVRPPAAGAVAAPTQADSAASDSVYVLPPIVVRARRLEPQQEILLLPGQASYIAIDPIGADAADVAEALDRLPGLHVRDFGSAGQASSVSIRGSTSAQVPIYLDGIPLTRGGMGVTNLADLPFAGLDHIDVYRGFAPLGLPSSGMGGAIQLVTRPAENPARPVRTAVVDAGSFGMRRFGASQLAPLAPDWSLLLVADLVRGDGDFPYLDDHGTPRNVADDRRTVRRNNWTEGEEILLKLGHGLGARGRIDLMNQWVRREQGVAGQPHYQAEQAEQGSVHDLTSASVALPSPRVQLRAHAFHDWRRDTFADPASELGLGYQDNRDVTQSFGGHAETSVLLPALQWVGVSLDGRHESFLPWRGYPRPEHAVPEQARTTTEIGLENRLLLLGGRLRLQGDLRRIREADDFSGDVTTAHSRQPAVSAERTYLEPQAGLLLRLLPGVHAEWSYGQHHRTPGFLELFGDAGAIAGSSDLKAEEGTHRDYGLDLEQSILGLQVRSELAHYSNRADHLITYIPTSQRVFVARNIGSARMQGEEASWRIAPRGDRPRWLFEGSYTHQHTEDLGVDRSWYAGNALPGRPEHRLHTRIGIELGPTAFAYQYEHMGRNYLDQANHIVAGRRDLHGIDLEVQMRAVTLRLAARNLTNDQAVDVAGFPVPGRTWSLSSAIRF